MSKRFKVKPLMWAMLPLLSVSGAFAEQNEGTSSNKKKTEAVEVIDVTGFRGSVIKSINHKRNSQTIVDSIYAEDIGKTTDQNIADALSRVTGVSIQSDDGEGTKISVRGAGSNQNNISLNGVTLTSSDENQSVDLSAFSADILSQISVYKTSAADHDEGSLGANVVLRTAKPLDLKDNIRSFEIQGRYNEFADKSDKKYNGSISHKFFDDTVGFILTGAYETQAVRRDEVGGHWQTPFRALTVKPRYNLDSDENPVGDELPIARDTDGNLVYGGDSYFAQQSLAYSLKQNQRDRMTLTGGLQFIPSDDTDIQLDFSYSKQVVDRDDHRVGVNSPNFWTNDDTNNLTVGSWGILQQGGQDILDENGNPVLNPAVADPQEDWWVIDQDTRTVTKSINRFSRGNINRQQSKVETINKVFTLNALHHFTDDFSMELKAGYSGTDFDDIYNENISTASWGTLPNQVLRNIPLNIIQPAGFDCSTGRCQMVVGEGDNNYNFLLGGVNNNQNNQTNTPFNPLDPNAHHLAQVTLWDQATKDTNASLFLDFDWNVDFMGIHKVEFGGKMSRRDKDTYRTSNIFEGPAESAFDPVTGEPLLNQSVSSIQASEVLDEGRWPVDDWMNGLIGANADYPAEFIDNGWGLINSRKALFSMFGLDDARLSPRDFDSRNIIQDTKALYAKINFEYLDGRLSGDLGLRYVKDDRESYGTTSLSYFRGDRVFTPNELVANGLLDPNNRACAPNIGTNRQLRLDGTGVVSAGATFNGFDINGNPVVYSEGDLVPTQYPCYDSLLAENANGDLVSLSEPNNRSWWQNFRHADASTVDFTVSGGDDLSIREIPSSAEFSTSTWLPSLNLNYQFSDDVIVRLALSKTMARPPIDDMRPNFSYSENIWGEKANITVFNPFLEVLTSNNIDISWEWYFNESGQVSVAFFSKDMKNFVEKVQDDVYYKDYRTEYGLSDTNGADFILPIPNDPTIAATYQAGAELPIDGQEGVFCNPDRLVQDQLKSSANFGCHVALASITRNGKGSSINGLEFTYRQTYDFLPAPFNGTGVDLNYTYAQSEYEPDTFELTGLELQALPEAFTPKHTFNSSLYWEKNGHSIKLTHRYNTEQLVNRNIAEGVLWLDQRGTLDLSASYKVNKNVSVYANMLNLTDEENRTFWTSSRVDMGDKVQDSNGNYLDSNDQIISLGDGTPASRAQIDADSTLSGLLVVQLFNEGNVIDDSSVTKNRTVTNYKTGRQYRLGIRVRF